VGKEAGAAMPVDELRETMRNVGLQIEKAFRIAADQMQEAFKTAKENIHQSTGTTSITCASCGQKNSKDSVYCCNCGKKLK
jgi:hypothetical protein